MIYLLYISDSYCPENEPFLAGVADCIEALEEMKTEAVNRFKWISDPSFRVVNTVVNQLSK